MATRNKRANRNVRSNESTRIIPVPDLDLFNKIVDGLNKLQDEELSEAKQGNLNTISKLNGRLFRHDEERIWATYWPILLDHISRATKLLASSSLDVPFLYHCFFGLMSTELRACWKSLGSTSTVWDCITFFMKHYGPSDPFRPPGFDIPIHEIITSILSHIMLRAYSTVREQQVTSSAGYLDIAIQLWLRSIIDIDIALESPAFTSCMMFSISKDCSEPNDGLSDTIADSIARIKGGSLALLVGILLPVKSRGLKGLQVALTILCACCYSSNTALQQDLLSKGAVVTITRALRKLAEPRAFNRELFCVGILFIEHFFRSLPESSQSPFDDSGVSADKPWMIQALEGRILCSVIEASHKIFCSCGALGAGDNNADSHGFASPMVSLLDRIAYFSRDERILRAIRKELRRIDSKGLNVAYAAKNGKPCLVWDAWVEFQSNVTPLVEVRKMFYMEPQEICSYSKCPNSKIIVKSAKRCGGCYLMYYCSRMCQKKDWKSGHKNVCWKNPLRYPGIPLQQTTLDVVFDRWIVDQNQKLVTSSTTSATSSSTSRAPSPSLRDTSSSTIAISPTSSATSSPAITTTSSTTIVPTSSTTSAKPSCTSSATSGTISPSSPTSSSTIATFPPTIATSTTTTLLRRLYRGLWKLIS